MHFRQVQIIRDETATLVARVGDWEVPLLEAKHGEERIIVGELKAAPNRAWPDDARSEFQRLTAAYGIAGSGDNAQSFCERVYGSGSTGVKNLAAAIEQAKATAEAESPAEVTETRRGPGRPRKEAAAELVG